MGQQDDLFWQLIERVHGRALAYCEHLAGNPADGGDLYHDAVVKAFEAFDKLREPASFGPWFYRIINNTFRERFRNPWWKRALAQFVDFGSLDIPINPIDRIEARRQLDYAMETLSPADRILVIMAELEDWSIAELAEMNRKSEGFIKMRLFRARQKMRRRLGARFRKSPQIETVMEGQEDYELPPGTTESK